MTDQVFETSFRNSRGRPGRRVEKGSAARACGARGAPSRLSGGRSPPNPPVFFFVLVEEVDDLMRKTESGSLIIYKL